MYSEVLLYYFSGTGNARNVTEWIAADFRCRNIPVTVFRIESGTKPDIENDRKKRLIGIISPTHGFNIPPNVIKFVFSFPKIRNADIFIANTRAGLKLSKIFLPGLSGIAQFLPALVFLFKGFRIVGMQPVDLPSNWISLHPGLRKKVVDSMHSRIEKKIKAFSEKLFKGKKTFKAFYSLPFDLAITPISIGYYLVGRFMLAKTFISTSKCTSCRLCEKQCPVKAIIFRNGRPYWTYDCESCMRCMNNCPARAIETPHGFVTIVWIFLFTIPPYLYSWLLKKYGICTCSLKFYHNLMYNIAEIVFIFIFVWFTYYLTFKLMRFRVTDLIIKYSSFTSYKFWRRYKAPKQSTLKDS